MRTSGASLSLSRYLVKLLLLIFLFELVIIVGIIIGGQWWLTRLKSHEMRVNVTEVPPQILEGLVVQLKNGNNEAFEFLIYELIQTRKLDFARFIEVPALETYLESRLGAQRCYDVLATRHCETSDGLVIGFAPVDFQSERLGYVIQETRINLSPSGINPANAGYMGMALALGFVVNMVGVMALFRRRVTREISQLKEALAAFRRGEDSCRATNPLAYSIGEFQDIAVTLDEATGFRKAAVASMQKATRAESMLQTAQMLAHDIRRPFTLVQAGLQTLRGVRDLAEAEHRAKALDDEVRRWIGSVNGMLDDLIELGGSPVFEAETLSLTDVLLGGLADVAMIRGYPDVPVKWILSETYLISGNANKLHRVIVNLLANALEATDGATTLSVACLPEGEWVRLAIENTGSSIHDDQRRRIFDVFYTKGKANGSGLGLAIAKQIIERHGGQIWCESSPATVTFVIRLPLHKLIQGTRDMPDNLRELREAQATETPSRPERQGATPMQAVAIDDDSFYRDYLLQTFSTDPALDETFDFKAFATPGMLALAGVESPDLILCDLSLTMAGLHGMEVIAQMRKTYPEALIVIHSDAVVLPADRAEVGLLDDSRVEVMPKPFDDRTIAKILTVLRGRKLT